MLEVHERLHRADKPQQVEDGHDRALELLGEYDAQHGTQLYDTLRCFVECRGSYVQTYTKLFIHRSTLQYRLERIVSIADVDFDDPRIWSHLALSFLLDECGASDCA